MKKIRARKIFYYFLVLKIHHLQYEKNYDKLIQSIRLRTNILKILTSK